MKKLLLLGAAIATLSLASCTKDYTCTCEYTFFGETGSDSYIYEDFSKSEATDSCDANNTFYSLLGGSCELD